MQCQNFHLLFYIRVVWGLRDNAWFIGISFQNVAGSLRAVVVDYADVLF